MLQDVNDEVRAMFRGILRADQDKRRERILASPRANRLTREFPDGATMNYRYWGNLKDGRGRRVRFCWSTGRNLAGWFLGWREVGPDKKGMTRRDQWIARRVRKRAKELQKRRHDKHYQARLTGLLAQE